MLRIFLMTISIRMDRYITLSTPFISLVISFFIIEMYRKFYKFQQFNYLWLIISAILTFPLIKGVIFVYQLSYPDTREAAMDWIEDQYSKDQLIISSGEANIITQNLQKYGYRKVINFYPIEQHIKLNQVPNALFLISSSDFRVWENYKNIDEMDLRWHAYQEIKARFKLIKKFNPPVVDANFFGLNELELSSTVNAYHNPVVEVYLIN